MLTIDIIRNSAQAIIGFRVIGHANTAPRGHDIVCAGVSALTQAAVIGLERHLGREFRLDIASGKLDMDLVQPPDDLTGAILETMVLGVAEIAKLNPRSVRIIDHRR